ncbi:hypothetical protein ACGFYP_33550 [Streptomyces sp. NPDC048370]|uniref:hypothetical protein n=1 Tax=Streptomyces sp. NPDC048370 TaxID=3365540 RepID=UPI00371C238E
MLQMTEPFAATVAAVAPVLILVGSVELSSVAKRGLLEAERAEEPMVRAHELIQNTTESRPADRDEVERLAREGEVKEPSAEAVGYFVAILGWVLLCLAMVIAFTHSLLYLASVGPKPRDQASFMFWTMTLGFVWVAGVPLALLGWRVQQGLAAYERKKSEVEAFLEHSAPARQVDDV